jgi:hypothetical protein
LAAVFPQSPVNTVIIKFIQPHSSVFPVLQLVPFFQFGMLTVADKADSKRYSSKEENNKL